MKIHLNGVTRIVIEFKNVVVKIPNFTCQWSHFLIGIVANIKENQTWKWNSGKYENGNSDLLCPVLWCSMGGWVLIMQKADVQKHQNEVYNEGKFFDYARFINSGFGGDDKPYNYGYYQNRLVKIDYGQ